MNRLLCLAAVPIGLALVAAPAVAEPTTWEIDPAHTAAGFTVRHMMVTNVRGKLGKVTGTVQYDKSAAKAATVEVTIDVTGIDTGEPKRDGHLKSPDFFDVAKFPTATFKSKRVEPAGAGHLKLIGDLTIHGVTKEIALDVEGPSPEMKDMKGTPVVAASATGKLSRKDFGLKWNMPLEGGGLLVGDEVTLTIDVELRKRQAAPVAGK